ncbi:hypothetical protein P152DRAFT_342933 [Eremomyces bilateralis CBS 781.70]|uniref:Uncharacterized protein n=1 Tax=Eremomyces bilateralis CBS 781.70 TaxID=1392243 RepID=A0A6G1G3E0_9PEZI|nr:uncharacterized protein P152DRAFT_342933 [Eremomyces bilateralis CBS 781.70]KAF1812574.1 hypothetical protein P152DRAFT_342933 [Eremomyces bilateralis CBS 781.70]
MSSPLGPWDLTDPTRLSPSLYESGVTPQVVISPAKSRDRTNSAQNADPAVNGLRRVSPGQALLAIQAVEFRDRDVDQIQEKEPVIADERLLVAIRTATAAEKELAIRVAQAAERLRGWCNEIQKWGWSGSFKMRDETDDEHAREEGINKAGNFDTVLNDNGPFTLTRINLHQTRLDDIQGSLSGLELEDLKDRVLGYYSSRSRPTSSYSHASRTESQLARLELMDDMPLLTTHLLMQCLPDLYSLRSSLDTWSVRLRVLRGLPQFLESLDHATKAMELGWEAIKPVASSGLTDTSITQHAEALTVIKGVLEQKITSLGRKLDDMLDALEGLEDSLPDQWIDDFEDLETEYGRWAVESRNGVLDLQMRLVKQQGQDVEQSSVPDETLSPTDIQHHDMLAGGPAILPDEIAVTQVQDGAKELIESATTQDVNRASSLEQPAASKIHSATDTDQEAADIPASPEPIGESSTRLPEHEPVREPSGDDDGGKADSRPPFPLKRASVTSIGSLPRAQVLLIPPSGLYPPLTSYLGQEHQYPSQQLWLDIRHASTHLFTRSLHGNFTFRSFKRSKSPYIRV